MAQNTEWLLGFFAAMSMMSRLTRIEDHVTGPLSDFSSYFLDLSFRYVTLFQYFHSLCKAFVDSNYNLR